MGQLYRAPLGLPLCSVCWRWSCLMKVTQWRSILQCLKQSWRDSTSKILKYGVYSLQSTVFNLKRIFVRMLAFWNVDKKFVKWLRMLVFSALASLHSWPLAVLISTHFRLHGLFAQLLTLLPWPHSNKQSWKLKTIDCSTTSKESSPEWTVIYVDPLYITYCTIQYKTVPQ